MTHIKSLTNISSFLLIYKVQGWRSLEATFSWVFSVQALAMPCGPLMFRLCAWTECYVNCSYFQPTVKPSFLFLALFCSKWFSLLCSEMVAVDALACAVWFSSHVFHAWGMWENSTVQPGIFPCSPSPGMQPSERERPRALEAEPGFLSLSSVTSQQPKLGQVPYSLCISVFSSIKWSQFYSTYRTTIRSAMMAYR